MSGSDIGALAIHLSTLVSKLPTSTEALAEIIDSAEHNPQFSSLLPEFQKRIYSHIISYLIQQNRYAEAEIYMNLGLVKDDDRFRPFRKLLDVKKKLSELAKLDPFAIGNAESIQETSSALLTDLNKTPAFWKQSIAVLHYNLGVTFAILGKREEALAELQASFRALTKEPCDRILRARVNCGLEHLVQPVKPDSSNFDSELSPEEKGSPDFALETDKWRRASRILLRREGLSPAP
jgi:hypothetical protein